MIKEYWINVYEIFGMSEVKNKSLEDAKRLSEMTKNWTYAKTLYRIHVELKRDIFS